MACIIITREELQAKKTARLFFLYNTIGEDIQGEN